MKWLDQRYQNLQNCSVSAKLPWRLLFPGTLGSRILIILLFFTLAFCQRKKTSDRASTAVQKSNLLENFTFSIDTLMVDTGDQLIGETKIKGLTTLPKGGFFKDGKLSSYVNVADELGFAVMDL